MKAPNVIPIIVLAFTATLVVGCEPSVPENPKPPAGTNPYVAGSPQERIKRIEADTTLSPEERARRIKVVKERNHLQ